MPLSSTAYGVQGATVPGSDTVLSDALDASGVYVGMIRGRETNRLHVVAASLDDAREQFTAALERDRADRGLVAVTQAAREAVAGLAADGPVRLVNTARTRLTERIEHADREANKWEQIIAALRRQVLGSTTPSAASARAGQWRARAAQARDDLTRIESLPVTETAQHVRELAARAEAEREAVARVEAEREARAARLHPYRPASDHGRTGPERDAPGL